MNGLLRMCLDSIQETYTSPKDYALAMSRFLETKQAVLNDIQQQIADIVSACDDQGRFYDIQSYIDDNRDILECPTESTVNAIGENFTPVGKDVDHIDESIAALSPDPIPADVANKINNLSKIAVSVDDTTTAYSEILMQYAKVRDGVSSEYSKVIDTASGAKLSLNDTINSMKTKVSDLSAFSVSLRTLSEEAAKQEDAEAESPQLSFAEISSSIREQMGSATASMSTGTISFLSSLVSGRGTVVDKVKAVSNLFSNMVTQSEQQASDSAGFTPTMYSLGNYQTVNASSAFADADFTVFNASIRAVKTVFTAAGVLIGKILQTGVSVVKTLWRKYIDPLISNHFITSLSGAESRCLDYPALTCRIDITDPTTGSLQNMAVMYTVNQGVKLKQLQQHLMTQWDMSAEELYQVFASNIPADHAYLIPTLFGEVYIYQVVQGRYKYAYLMLCLAPTSQALTHATYWHSSYSDVPAVSDWSHFSAIKGFCAIKSDTGSVAFLHPNSYLSIAEVLKDYFGYDWSAMTIQPVVDSDFDASQPSQLLDGLRSSLMRWTVYMSLRYLCNSTDFNWDQYISTRVTTATPLANGFRLLDGIPYYQKDVYFSQSTTSLSETLFRMYFMIGLPVYIIGCSQTTDLTTAKLTIDVGCFGSYFNVSWYPNQAPNLIAESMMRNILTTRVTSNAVSAHYNYLAAACALTPQGVVWDQVSMVQNAICLLSADYPNIAGSTSSWHSDGWNADITAAYNTAPFVYSFLVAIITNKKDVMKKIYTLYDDFPHFIPYVDAVSVRKPAWHSVTTQEMLDKAQRLKNAVFTVVSLVAVAATAVMASVIIKKKVRTSLTNYAVKSETARYNYEDLLSAYNTQSQYDGVGLSRIPLYTDVYGDAKLPNGKPNPSPINPDGLNHWSEADRDRIEKAYQSGSVIDMPDTWDGCYIYEADVNHYKNLYVKTQKRNNLVSQVTSKLTGVTEDYAGYVDYSTEDAGTSEPEPCSIDAVYERLTGTPFN